jgi:Tfp pilus assembly protein PilF
VVHFYLGRSLLGQKKPTEAEAELRTALSIGGSEMVEAHRALANIYLERGENEKALSELETYLAANPAPADEKKLRDTIQQIKDLLKGSRKP